MDTLPTDPPPADLPVEGSDESKKSLVDLRKQLETGQTPVPPSGEEGMIENKNQPLANPKIQTPNIGNPKPE